MKKGFTITETLISIAVLIIVSSIIFFSFSALNNKQTLKAEKDMIISLIDTVRLNALNSKDGEDQKIIFGTTTISYDGSTTTLTSGISLYSYNTGTTSIVFRRLSGFPNATGTLFYQFRKGNATLGTTSISINNLGVIE